MNRTFLTLAVAAQLAAVSAYAQTSTTASTTSDTSATSATFGSDWSSTLGPAMFDTDRTTVRSAPDIVNQWSTLSDDDKTMLRRDCTAYMQQSGGTNGNVTSGTGEAATGTTTGGTTGSTDSNAGTTGSTTGTDGTSTAGGTASSSGSAAGASTMINVSMEQMKQICDATQGL